MAIKRCPYCRALIDEKDQYCNNCGTQLLFPEDAEVEEEIPGEKIIDADVEEKDYEIPEPGAEKEFVEEEEDDDDEDEPEEVILVDEIKAIEDSPAPPGEGEEDEPVKEPEKPEVEELGAPAEEEKPVEPKEVPPVVEEEEAPAEPVIEAKAEEPAPEAELETEAEIPGEQKAVTFDTRDLDKIGRTAELGKEQIDKFLDALKEGAENMDFMTRQGREPEAAREADEGLPPWASGMKETPPPVETPAPEDTGMTEEDAGEREMEQMEQQAQEEDLEEIQEERPSPRLPDSGIGLPEKVTQAALPFEKPIRREEAAVEAPRAPVRREWPLRDEEEEPEEAVEAPKERPPLRLSAYLKAKAFDILFVTVFWLVSLWLAARSMDATLFQIIGAASTGLFVFLGILLGLYFFLFYFFLGETLGDRLFRDED